MVRIYGKNHRAVTQTYAILGQITDDEDDPFRTLKNKAWRDQNSR